MKLNKNIVKACDIRGIYGESINEEDLYSIGRAFSTLLHRDNIKSVVVGYDGRLSSESLSKSLIEGLSDGGVDVINISLVSSPALYFAVYNLNIDAAIMVTASHNPKQYNGCKFVIKDKIFHGPSLKELEKICENEEYFESSVKGKIENIDIKERYINYLKIQLGTLNLKKAKIIWDGGNGASLFFLKDFLNTLDGEHQIIAETIDGNFPSHEPDPSKEENLTLLKETVIKEHADMGIAFDGDGDRVAIVDSNGRYLSGDKLLIILSKFFLKNHPGEKVMSEVKASALLYKSIKDWGGIPVMWKVGHTNQKQKMMDDNILFAGETSGHIFYKENNLQDDGMFAAIKVLKYIYSGEKTLSQINDEIPKIFTTNEIRFSMDYSIRDEFINKIKNNLIKDGRTFIDIDGMRVNYNSGFWLLRQSNTQPQITSYVESLNEEDFELCVSDLKSYIKSAGFCYEDLI